MEATPSSPSSEQATATPSQPMVSSSVQATAPGQLKVIKRNGTVVPYDESKIAVAITKAFLAVEGAAAAASGRIHTTVNNLMTQVTETFKRRMPSGGTVHIEDIQDQVELALMRSGEHRVARDYVLYREEHARARAERRETSAEAAEGAGAQINVVYADGRTGPLDIERIRTLVREACTSLDAVDAERIIDEAMSNMYDGISQKDVSTSLLITARTLVEEEGLRPDWRQLPTTPRPNGRHGARRSGRSREIGREDHARGAHSDGAKPTHRWLCPRPPQ